MAKKTRNWSRKYCDRLARRLVISGGAVSFLDATLNFPEGVGLIYATPLFWDGPDAYESSTSRTIALLAGRSRLFLDIGSNIGIYSVYAGVKFPEVKVFAFEPIPSIWKKNVAFHRANQLPEQNVLNIAVSDRDGLQQIFLPVCVGGLEEEQTATLCENSWQTHEEKVEAVEIKCVTLDTFTATNTLPEGFCAIKIDVENFEAGVLRGGRKFIQNRRPWIVCEILPGQKIDPVTKARSNNNSEVMALIQDLHYVAFAITNDGFFRMASDDFNRPRGIKDFLLLPQEKVSADVSYLALASLAQLQTGTL